MNLKEIPDIRCDPLRYCLKNNIINHHGLWLEFGVYKGQTLDLISSYTDQEVYGFDTFSGIDQEWSGTSSGSMNGFNIGGKPPSSVIPLDKDRRYGNNTGARRPFNKNVNFICGDFRQTLPHFLEKNSADISFMHIDCDLYESTEVIFKYCGNLLQKGSVVVFDELVNYKGYQQDELKAFNEFIAKNKNFHFKWIGMDGRVLSDKELDRLGNYDKMSKEDRESFMQNPPGFSVALLVK